MIASHHHMKLLVMLACFCFTLGNCSRSDLTPEAVGTKFGSDAHSISKIRKAVVQQADQMVEKELADQMLDKELVVNVEEKKELAVNVDSTGNFRRAVSHKVNTGTPLDYFDGTGCEYKDAKRGDKTLSVYSSRWLCSKTQSEIDEYVQTYEEAGITVTCDCWEKFNAASAGEVDYDLSTVFDTATCTLFGEEHRPPASADGACNMSPEDIRRMQQQQYDCDCWDRPKCWRNRPSGAKWYLDIHDEEDLCPTDEDSATYLKGRGYECDPARCSSWS